MRNECPKCCGLLVPTWLTDFQELNPRYANIAAMRCVMCGYVGDELTRQRYLARIREGVAI